MKLFEKLKDPDFIPYRKKDMIEKLEERVKRLKNSLDKLSGEEKTSAEEKISLFETKIVEYKDLTDMTQEQIEAEKTRRKNSDLEVWSHLK